MKIRKYFAADMRQALNLARQQQGPEVVILGNRKVLGGVELIAAEDYDESLFIADEVAENLHKASTVVSTETEDDSVSAAVNSINNDVDNPEQVAESNNVMWSKEPSLNLMQQEIQSLRKLLEQQMSGLAWGDVGRRHPLWAGLLRKLGGLGISPTIAREIVEQIPEKYSLEQAWRTTLALLSYRIPVQNDNLLTQNSIIAFAGASGTGKTTTIAKLAAKYAIENSSKDIVLATLDSYRVGGREQLSSYAKIIGVPLRSINHAKDLSELIDQFYGRKLILIDTAGLSPNDKRQNEQVSILRSVKTPIHMCLVLSATSQITTLNQVIETNRILKPNLCVLTKLDEASAFGDVLSVVINEGLKIIYQCAGQQVPEDLQQANATDLIARAMSMMKRYGNEDNEDHIEQSYGKYAVYHPLGGFT